MYNPILDKDIPDTIPYKPPKKKRVRRKLKRLTDQEKKFARSYAMHLDSTLACKICDLYFDLLEGEQLEKYKEVMA